MTRALLATALAGASAVLALAYGCSSGGTPSEHVAAFEAGTSGGEDGEGDSAPPPSGASDAAGEAGSVDAGGLDAGGGASDAGAVDGALPFTCASLCKEAFASCTQDQIGYGTQLICASECAVFEAGTLGDTNDSLGCRLAQAERAAGDAAAHCPSAGASGGGECGTRCDAYCALVFGICVASNRDAGNPYASMGDCMTACAGFAVEDGGPEYDPVPSDTLNCRQYRLQQAWSDPVGGSAFDDCPNLGKVSPLCK